MKCDRCETSKAVIKGVWAELNEYKTRVIELEIAIGKSKIECTCTVKCYEYAEDRKALMEVHRKKPKIIFGACHRRVSDEAV